MYGINQASKGKASTQWHWWTDRSQLILQGLGMSRLTHTVFALSVGVISQYSLAFDTGSYVQITNSGNSYASPNIFFMKDHSLGLVDDIKRQTFADLPTQNTFKAGNGMYGKVYATFPTKYEQLYIIETMGNYTLLNETGLQAATKAEYQEFVNKTNRPVPHFGLQLCKTTPQEALKIVEQAGTNIERYYYYGASNLPFMLLKNHPDTPIVEGIKANDFILYFKDNKLAQIRLNWRPESKSSSDRKRYQEAKMFIALPEAIVLKYRSEQDEFALRTQIIDTRDGVKEYRYHLWLNNQQDVTYLSWENYVGNTIEYNCTEMYDGFNQAKHSAKLDYQNRKEQKRKSDNANAL